MPLQETLLNTARLNAAKKGLTLLQYLVLRATDPLHPCDEQAAHLAQILLAQGEKAHGCLNAIVERDELYFEATDPQSPHYAAAIQNALVLIPLLRTAGDRLSDQHFSSAKYNCAPAIQALLR